MSDDFATLLEKSFQESQPERGDIVTGTILSIDEKGLLVDVGLKSDGVVMWSDVDRLGPERAFSIGQAVPVMITRDDNDGNLLVSIAQAKQLEDWTHAENLMKQDQVWEGQIIDANKGGVIIQFGNLRGFVPASHVVGLPRDLSEDERKFQLKRMIGQMMICKVIEVNRKRRRLVLSEREAQREQRDQRKDDLLDNLNEGDIVKGVISGIRDFGAFVDLGGADGLIHISEMAWHRVNHPREVVALRQKVEVYVLRLDRENKRIELSLKRMLPNPWAEIETRYHIGQLVSGTINRVTDFGAFINLEPGIEGLLHGNHLADPIPQNLAEVLKEGETLLLRVISIESENQRLGLSLRDVTESEWAAWQENRIETGQTPENSLESSETPLGA